MKSTKRILSALLAVLMLLTVIPFSTFALEIDGKEFTVNETGWTKVTVPSTEPTKYVYTLDTNGIDAGEDYIIAAPNNTVLLRNNSGSVGTYNFNNEVSGNTITLTTAGYEMSVNTTELFTSNTVSASFGSGNTANLANAAKYYVLVNGQYKKVTSATCTRTKKGFSSNYSYAWTVNYEGGTSPVTFNIGSIVLYTLGKGYTFYNGQYLGLSSNNGLRFNADEKVWFIEDIGSGSYRIYDGVRYIRYNSGFTTDTSSRSVRLYKRTNTIVPQPSYYYLASDAADQYFSTARFADQAALEAYLKETFSVVKADDDTGLNAKLVDYVLTASETVDPAVPGTVTYTVSYDGHTVSTFNVTFVESAFTLELLQNEGTVQVSSEKHNTDAYLKVTYDDDRLDDEVIEITTEMLTGVYDLDTIADYTGLEVVYGGQTADGDFTLHVVEKKWVKPSDGTGDFPEYPNQGSIRFDKVGQAVGSFSKTGIAQVELSMTGVPYTNENAIDVVIMLDMTKSMTTQRVAATKAATKTMLQSLVINEDGTYTNNRIAVFVFYGSGSNHEQQAVQVYPFSGNSNPMDVVTEDDYSNLVTAIEGLKTGSENGTPFDAALEKCNNLLKHTYDPARQQFVVFMTDGCPTDFEVFNNVPEESVTEIPAHYNISNITRYYQGNADMVNYKDKEYYSYLMKHPELSDPDHENRPPVTIYTVGLGIGTTGNAVYTRNFLTSIATDKNKAYYIADENAAAGMNEVFAGITSEIVEAAKDVTVTDKIADAYTLVFDAPNTDVADNLPSDFGGFKVEFVEYTLDANHERIGSGTLKETIDLSKATVSTDENGNTVYTLTSCEEATKPTTVTRIEKDNGEYRYDIDAWYFTYDSETRLINWKLDKITNTELVLRYYLYLDNSQGHVGETEEKEAGTYDTNDWATLSYTNFDGNDCQQDFPVPQLTWNGAQVSYVFYLVNKDGEPVNKAGRVVDFANASFVTDVFTASVVWNAENASSLVKAYEAKNLIPSGYHLYDDAAQYEINVFADEETDRNTFIISGSDTVDNKNTTKVYNTKAGTKYVDHGTYSNEKGDGIDYTITGFDFANTTVAFALLWEPELVSDTVVVDYGIPVEIDVCANDKFDNFLHGISATEPDIENPEDTINVGILPDGVKFGTAPFSTAVGTFTKTDKNKILFTPTTMLFTEPVTVYYDTEVSYYVGSEKQTGYMYSSLTVIPATALYFEDDEKFVTFTGNWTAVGTAEDKTQSQDRPGAADLSALIDADNIYGYDPAYTACTEFSLGKAMKATASASDKTAPTATFTFTGTGFDILSMTNTTTGTIIVDVKDADGKTEKNLIVDSYYGCACTPQYYKRTYRYSDAWHIGGAVEVTEAEYEAGKANTLPDKPKPYTSIDLFEIGYKWETTTASYDTLYQIPVINCYDLAYGTHTVTVRMFYHPLFQHVKNKTSYDFYFDAVRIYNPAQGNTEAESTYVEDHEGFPVFTEIRDHLIDGEAFSGSENVSGIVFIDGFGIIDDTMDDSMFNYTHFGPNNEVYLAQTQAIAFKLDAEGLDRIHIGAKRVTGSAVLDVNGKKTTIATATDMYYDITDSIGTDGTVIIKNSGEGILSLTNLKFTYAEAPAKAAKLSVSRVTAYLAANTVRNDYLASKTVAFTPKLSVYTNGKTVKIGDSVNVTVTAPADVTALTVNGVEATAGKTNAKTGRVTWTAALTADTENAFTVSVVAENEYGCISKAKETELKTVGQDEQIIRTDIAVTDTPATVLESIFG